MRQVTVGNVDELSQERTVVSLRPNLPFGTTLLMLYSLNGLYQTLYDPHRAR